MDMIFFCLSFLIFFVYLVADRNDTKNYANVLIKMKKSLNAVWIGIVMIQSTKFSIFTLHPNLDLNPKSRVKIRFFLGYKNVKFLNMRETFLTYIFELLKPVCDGFHNTMNVYLSKNY